MSLHNLSQEDLLQIANELTGKLKIVIDEIEDENLLREVINLKDDLVCKQMSLDKNFIICNKEKVARPTEKMRKVLTI